MAKKPKRSRGEILSRTVKWPITLTTAQEDLVLQISDALREYYNWALMIQMENHDRYEAARKATPDAKPTGKKFLSEIDLYSLWRPKRVEDQLTGLFRAKVPANWVLETFKASVAGYKSFFSLLKNGDTDAHPPKYIPAQLFQAIPGCSAFSVKGNSVVLAPDIFGYDTFIFPVPAAYQAGMLARSIRNAKFVISRDERILEKIGVYSISVSYEIAIPEQEPFVPEKAVYVALGASSIGIVSSKGEVTIPLWRADKYWKPKTEAIEASLSGVASPRTPRPIQKGSRKWKKLSAKRRKMFAIMGAQQKLNRREVVAGKLLGIESFADLLPAILTGHGVHFVVTDLVVRSKTGKLADAQNETRGGSQGLNWAAQNTGSISYLVDWLTEKVREHGGSVRKHKLSHEVLPQGLGIGHENKIPIARALQDDFLRSLSSATA